MAVVASVAAIGCGGGSSSSSSSSSQSDGTADESAEQAAVRDALNAYATAVVKNDAKTACSLLTANAQHQAAQTVPGASTCERAHQTAFGSIGQDKRQQFADQIKGADFDVKVTGTTAILTSDKSDKPLRMRKVGGAWRIDYNTVSFNK
jgi:hypothetical protein